MRVVNRVAYVDEAAEQPAQPERPPAAVFVQRGVGVKLID